MFVDADSYTLIDHPNNYYCVALGIARLRAQMGWEDGSRPRRNCLPGSPRTIDSIRATTALLG
jgi:hypothetical protein